MSTIGILVLAMFGSLWAGAGLVSSGQPNAWLALPALVFAALAAAALRIGEAGNGRSVAERKRIGRLITTWSIVEGVAIFVAVNLANSLWPAAALPSVLAVVALHFVPLARGIPFPPYYSVAVLLLTISGVGLLLPPTAQLFVITGGAALVLWATALLILGRLNRGARAPGGAASRPARP